MHPVEVERFPRGAHAGGLFTQDDDTVALRDVLPGFESLDVEQLVHGCEKLPDFLTTGASSACCELSGSWSYPLDLLVERLEQSIDVPTPERFVAPPNNIEIVFAHAVSFGVT